MVKDGKISMQKLSVGQLHMKKIGRLQVSTTKNSVHGASEVQLRIQKHWFVVCIT